MFLARTALIWDGEMEGGCCSASSIMNPPTLVCIQPKEEGNNRKTGVEIGARGMSWERVRAILRARNR